MHIRCPAYALAKVCSHCEIQLDEKTRYMLKKPENIRLTYIAYTRSDRRSDRRRDDRLDSRLVYTTGDRWRDDRSDSCGDDRPVYTAYYVTSVAMPIIYARNC